LRYSDAFQHFQNRYISSATRLSRDLQEDVQEQMLMQPQTIRPCLR
jgi:hypothetical protein